MKKIVVLASGSGTNAENIVRYFEESDLAKVVAIITNNPQAGVLDKARKLGVQATVLTNSQIEDGTLQGKLENLRCDLVVLAGFLRKIPAELIQAFEKRIINIHPALLPDYGGPGMYGKYVHQAVVENEEEVSGITIHYVDENYDEGEIIFQEEVEIDYEDSWEDVEYKVRELEYRHYPSVIEYLLPNI
ncbi:phosphoribosylglycinamide formyltransferase [Croceimicrobium sp.]|uniref:phosphoribosylglycinamide formyltransferase n=1 Tax=Croceimicrobium sp. TaxID=2828340 RepID=UPI003BAD27F4